MFTSPGHVGIDTHDDPVGQLMSSHHWTLLDGQWVQASGQVVVYAKPS